MSTFVHSYSSRHVLCVDHNEYETVGDLKRFLADEKGISLDAHFLVCNGVIAADDKPVLENVVYHTYLRIAGGKGGFGSMLRAIGAQIEKTTNHEACRDLSGRRMRDVNNEKDLKEWLGKQSERERAREQRRQERLERRRAMPNHKFDDPLYDQQRSLLAENQEDALQKGLLKFVPKPGSSVSGMSTDDVSSKRKREAHASSTAKKKKATEWLGVDMDDMSDLDSEDNESSSDSNTPPATTSASNTDEPSSHSASSEICPDTEQNSTNTSAANDNAQPGSAPGETNTSSNCKPCVNSDNSEHDGSEACNLDTSAKKQEDDMSVIEAQEEPVVTLDEATSAKHLESLGLEKLKQELMDRGLKCGGTLEQRAERLFSVKGLARDQIDPSLFSKTTDGKKVKNRR